MLESVAEPLTANTLTHDVQTEVSNSREEVFIGANRLVHLASLRLGTAFCLDVAPHIGPHLFNTTCAFQSRVLRSLRGWQWRHHSPPTNLCYRRTQCAYTPTLRHTPIIQRSSFITVLLNSWKSVTANHWVSGINKVTNKLNEQGSGLTKATADSGDVVQIRKFIWNVDDFVPEYRQTGQSFCT